MCKPHDSEKGWLGFLWVPHTECIGVRPVYAQRLPSSPESWTEREAAKEGPGQQGAEAEDSERGGCVLPWPLPEGTCPSASGSAVSRQPPAPSVQGCEALSSQAALNPLSTASVKGLLVAAHPGLPRALGSELCWVGVGRDLVRFASGLRFPLPILLPSYLFHKFKSQLELQTSFQSMSAY